MAACQNILGVKNLTIAFTDCLGTAGGVGNVAPTAHTMSQDNLPMIDSVPYKNEALSGGWVKRTYQNCTIKLDIMRNAAIPLSYYQGRAEMDIQIEYLNGATWTGTSGAVTDTDESDTLEVSFTVSYNTLTEVLAPAS